MKAVFLGILLLLGLTGCREAARVWYTTPLELETLDVDLNETEKVTIQVRPDWGHFNQVELELSPVTFANQAAFYLTRPAVWSCAFEHCDEFNVKIHVKMIWEDTFKREVYGTTTVMARFVRGPQGELLMETLDSVPGFRVFELARHRASGKVVFFDRSRPVGFETEQNPDGPYGHLKDRVRWEAEGGLLESLIGVRNIDSAPHRRIFDNKGLNVADWLLPRHMSFPDRLGDDFPTVDEKNLPPVLKRLLDENDPGSAKPCEGLTTGS